MWGEVGDRAAPGVDLLEVTCAVVRLVAAAQCRALSAAAAAAGRARAMGAELPVGLRVCADDPAAAQRQVGEVLDRGFAQRQVGEVLDRGFPHLSLR
eukprot:g58565.t1